MIVLLFYLFILIKTDIPVHCEFPQVEGTWTFHLTDKKYDSGQIVYNVCDIKAPIEPSFTKTFKLSAPNFAVDENGYIGTWTMIFDQGLEITMSHEKYFAYFKYTEDNAVNFTSHCDQTFTGTYHRNVIKARKWGCFYGEKISKVEKKSYPKKYFISEPEEFRNDLDLVKRVNSDPESSWKATTYPSWEGKRLSFGKPSHPIRHESKKRHMESFKRRNQKIMVNDLPKSWDWRNISGVNYVSPVRAQLMCGSCYSFSTLGMFETKQRIETNNQYKPIYAVQDILDCSVYSQGCDGGMPYLVLKYSKDFGIVDEECDPYRGQTGVVCADKQCPKRTFAYEYGYIGGYYGAADEENMMRAIFERGPVAIAFAVFADLKQYHSGVYHCPKETANAPTPKFLSADHAVLIVGYSETPEGEKYWIVKNSWGTVWGNEGYFNIAKGVNECNIESLVVSGEIMNYDMFEY